MNYDETLESFLESDDEGFTDEGWDKESAEALPRYRRAYSKGGRTSVAQPRAARPVQGVKGGVVQTAGGGRAQVNLPAPVATKEAVDAAIKELKADIAKQAEALRKVDKTLDTNTSVLDKKITSVQGEVKKMAQSSQFSALLPLLISKPPEIDSIKAKGQTTAVEIESTKYKSGDNSGLLLAMLAMSGGFGGGSGSGDSSSALLLAVALGGFGK